MKRHLFLVCVAVVLFAGCDFGTPSSHRPFLYERMGGEEAVAASVESFYDLLKADPLMFRTFEPVFEDETGTRSARFKAMMAAWMCTMAEGNCWYEGLSMSTAHSHMDITEQEFDVMMVHLDDAMELNSVGELERQEMIDLFNDMKYQVVQ